jgi:hypothetical protein
VLDFVAARVSFTPDEYARMAVEVAEAGAVRGLQWLHRHGVPMTVDVVMRAHVRSLRFLHETGDLARLWTPELWLRMFSHARYEGVRFLRDEARVAWDAVAFTQAVLRTVHLGDEDTVLRFSIVHMAGLPLDASPETLALALRFRRPETARWLCHH